MTIDDGIQRYARNTAIVRKMMPHNTRKPQQTVGMHGSCILESNLVQSHIQPCTVS